MAERLWEFDSLTIRMNREELAWAAGFIDGEGTFGIQKQKGKKPIPYLQAGQIDRQVLDRLQEALGLGKVYGPYAPRKVAHSSYFYFRLTGEEKVILAGDLLSEFLSPVKQDQFRRACNGVTPNLGGA